MQLQSNLSSSQLKALAYQAGILEVLASEIVRRVKARNHPRRTMEHQVTEVTRSAHLTMAGAAQEMGG